MIRILRSGSHMCIVDNGRYGYQSQGVSHSGAMDLQSAMAANSLVNNPIDYPVLEFFQAGHKIEFLADLTIAITGANADMRLNDQILEINTHLTVQKGDILTIGKMYTGVRNYLSFGGKILADKVLGSYSPIPFFNDTTCHRKDEIDIKLRSGLQHGHTHILPNKIDPSEMLSLAIGPEFDFLNEKEQNRFLTSNYRITKYNDRMGYKLEGSGISANTKEILSSAVLPGTIQLLPSGQLIILMRDCQTTGGYPRIGQLYPRAINQLAQRSTGSTVHFLRNDL